MDVIKVIVPVLVTLLFCLISCSDQAKDKKNDVLNEKHDEKVRVEPFDIDRYANELEAQKASGELTGYYYVNMSHCGGSLSGYYKGDSLMFIHSVYAGEAGFHREDVYWKNEEVVRIVYQEHMPIWEKFKEPDNATENYFAEMTYTDTIYKVDLGKNWTQIKFSGTDTVSLELDSVLIKRLIDCSFEMKKELEEDKILIKDDK